MQGTELWHLMGTYFHEDFEGLDETLTEYLSETTSADLATLTREIDELLRSTPSQDLSHRLYDLGSRVWLGEDASSYVAWLNSIRAAAAAQSQPD